MPKIVFYITVTLIQGQRSGSRSRVKVKGQGQLSGAQRSILGARLCRVQQRAKRSHYQSKVIVCVSVISRHVRLIARMWSIGVLIYFNSHHADIIRILCGQVISCRPVILYKFIVIFQSVFMGSTGCIGCQFSLLNGRVDG